MMIWKARHRQASWWSELSTTVRGSTMGTLASSIIDRISDGKIVLVFICLFRTAFVRTQYS